MSSKWSARSLSAGYGSKGVLESLDLDFPLGQVTSIVGPGKSGKTTLLRVLRQSAEPTDLWVRGDLRAHSGPIYYLDQQSARSLPTAELLRQLKATSVGTLLMLDEPFFSRSDDEREQLIRWLLEARGPRTLIWVTHNVALARRLSNQVILLADGDLVEAAPTDDFFERPKQKRTAEFLVTGS